MRSGFECRTEIVWASWWRSLSNVHRLSSRWLKRAPERAGQVSASGLAVDHSKDDTMSSSEIASEPVWSLRTVADAAALQSLPFIWALLVKYPQVCSELAVFCAAVLSSLFPGHTAAAPFEPLRMLAESWKINALTLGREELGFGQFGPSCVNYSFVRRDSVTNAAAAEVHWRQRISRLYHIAALISETHSNSLSAALPHFL